MNTALIFLLGIMAIAAPMSRMMMPNDCPPSQHYSIWQDVLVATLLTFLSPNLTGYFFSLTAYSVFRSIQSTQEPTLRISVFLTLLLTSPGMTWTPSGGDIFNTLVEVTPARVLSLTLLLPLMFLENGKSSQRRPSRIIDAAVFLYPAWSIALNLDGHSTSHLLRVIIHSLLDVIVPYFAISRHIHDAKAVRRIGHAILVSSTFLAAVATFEYFKRWQLYVDLQGHYDFVWQLTRTLFRNDALRAQAMTPQPILLAIDIIFAFGWFFIIRSSHKNKWSWWMAGLFALALLATGSRGPMVGTAMLLILVYAGTITSPRAFSWTASALLVSAFGVMFTGLIDEIALAMKAFFNLSAENAGSIDYRRELFTTSVELIKQSPWIGVPNFAAHMQNLRQGEGIIDMVNAYIHIALSHGLIGVAFYLAPSMLVLFGILHAMQGCSQEYRAIYAASVALMAGILLTLITTSIFYIIPQLVVCLFAVPAGLLSNKNATSESQRPAESSGRPQASAI